MQQTPYAPTMRPFTHTCVDLRSLQYTSRCVVVTGHLAGCLLVGFWLQLVSSANMQQQVVATCGLVAAAACKGCVCTSAGAQLLLSANGHRHTACVPVRHRAASIPGVRLFACSCCVAVNCCLQFLLFTNDIEKLPSNMWCDVGSEASSCAPGFFQTLAPDVKDPTAPAVTQPHACCPGYFCPAMLTCMIPCPLGSYCPR